MPAATDIGVDAAFVELYDLLRAIAEGKAPDRREAVAYASRRAILLASPQSNLLPGFLTQCLTVVRYRDFITLYDPDPAVRARFVGTAFDRCRAAFEIEGAFDALESRKPASPQWTW